MGKTPADQFYWGDWLNDSELQACTSTTRGVWINALCRMWFAPIRGEVTGTRTELKRLLNASDTDWECFSLDRANHAFCDVITQMITEKSVIKSVIRNVLITGDETQMITLRNRRMYRNAKDKSNAYLRLKRYRQKKHDNAIDNPPDNANETVASSSSSTRSPIIPLRNETLFPGPKNTQPDYQAIRKLWREICPSLPQPRPENKTWYPNCRARFHQYDRFRTEGSEWVAKFFRKFMANPWWENGKYNPPNIGWVWKPTNFFRIIERKEDQHD